MPSSGCKTSALDRKSTRLNSSHTIISYAVFCLKKTQHTPNNDRAPAAPRRSNTAALGPPPHLPPTHPRRARRSSPLDGLDRRAQFFFFNDTATTEIYTLSLHDALPI